MTLKKGEVAAAEDTSPLTLDGSSYDVEKLLKGAEAAGKTRQQIIAEADNLPEFQTGGSFVAPLPAGHDPEPEGEETTVDAEAAADEAQDRRVTADPEPEGEEAKPNRRR